MEITLNDLNFEDELQKAEKPVLVDFWAIFCSPCLMLSPILEKLSEEYKDKLIFAKVDIEKAPLAAQRYGIEQIPTVILFKGGKPINGFIGARPEPVVKELLDKMLKDVKNY